MILLLLLETIDIIYTTESKPNKLIQNICDTLYSDNSLSIDENQQWELICQELFHSKDEDKYIKEEQHSNKDENTSQNKQMNKAIRITGGIRSGIRSGSSGIRTGIRTSPSITRYSNTRTGATIFRPNGWIWSRSRLMFLPLATRYLYRSRSSSNRYTTPATSSQTYYYCTANNDASVEIQCSSVSGDSQCCEDQEGKQPFCCGGDIPEDYVEDMNRATKRIAQVFYTLTALALCMHLLVRRFYR
ncbi:unnamed protein product [Rotaria sp. Silwood2]|nr:unnamed protein product [Rotaria sp. Silwood2]CAF2988628.1 unnamed protein product [Rotaria sp. Silwood2]CAF4099774.1 unnamed protein product [Rotaria sp. Silwood2]CAF4190546.1 unnamed protein product [Rotaria sp. Silwood2]